MIQSTRTADSSPSRPARPSGGLFKNLSSCLCDLLCLAFALWTVLCNVVVMFGGNLYHLLWLSIGAFGAALAIGAWRVTTTAGERRNGAPDVLVTSVDQPQRRYPPFWESVALLIALATLLVVSYVSQDRRLLWCGAMPYLLYLLWRDFGLASEATRQDRWTSANECAVWAVALIMLILTFFWPASCADDSFYLSLAVKTADQPQLPLLGGDTIFGLEGAPLLLPTYRVHSVELLSGAVSFLTGMPAIYLAHVVIPALVIPLIPAIYAKLFRLLIPRRAVWATLVVALIMVVPVCYLSQKWKILAIPQLGKTMYVGAFIPLIICYGVQFGRRLNSRNFLLLVAAQVGAVGMTATALWQAPVVAFLAVASSIDVNWEGAKRLATGVLSSGYVLGLAMLLRQETHASTAGTLLDRIGREDLFEYAHNRFSFASSLAVVFVLAAWWTCRESTCRRLCLLFPLATLVLWNPLCPDIVASNLTGHMTYFRVLWILPVIFSAAIVLTMPLTLTVQNKRLRRLRNALALCAVIAFVIAPQLHAMATHPLARSAIGRLRAGEPQVLKVAAEYWIAKDLNRFAGEGNRVLAPLEIETWVTTVHRYSYPICSRNEYFDIMYSHFTDEERSRRRLARDYISKLPQGDKPRKAFHQLIKTDDRLSAVCIRESHPLADDMATMLEQNGFKKCARHSAPRLAPKIHYQYYHIWKRVADNANAARLADNKMY